MHGELVILPRPRRASITVHCHGAWMVPHCDVNFFMPTVLIYPTPAFHSVYGVYCIHCVYRTVPSPVHCQRMFPLRKNAARNGRKLGRFAFIQYCTVCTLPSATSIEPFSQSMGTQMTTRIRDGVDWHLSDVEHRTRTTMVDRGDRDDQCDVELKHTEEWEAPSSSSAIYSCP